MSGYIGISTQARSLTNLGNNNLDTSLWVSSVNSNYYSLSVPTGEDYFSLQWVRSSSAGEFYIRQSISPIGPGNANHNDKVYIQVKVRGYSTNQTGYPTLCEYSKKYSDNASYYYAVASTTLDNKTGIEINDNNWHILSGITTTYTENDRYTIQAVCLSMQGASSNDKIDFKDIIVINLTSIFGEGNEPSADECNQKIIYKDGIVYYKDAEGSFILSNYKASIKKMYIGINGITKEIKNAYIGVNNIAKKWYGEITLEDILKEVEFLAIQGRNENSTGTFYISKSSDTRTQYLLSICPVSSTSTGFGIYQIKNGSVTQVIYKASSYYSGYYNDTNHNRWYYASAENASSASSQFGGTLALITFPNKYSDDVIEAILKNINPSTIVANGSILSAPSNKQVATSDKTHPFLLCARANFLDFRKGDIETYSIIRKSSSSADISAAYVTGSGSSSSLILGTSSNNRVYVGTILALDEKTE